MPLFKNIWQQAVERLSHSISETAMSLWINPIYPVSFENDCAILMVDSPFQRDVIMTKYKEQICQELTSIVGFEMGINVVTKEDKTYAHKAARHVESLKVDIDEYVAENVEPIYPEFTFDTFVVGDSNKHAHAACLAVAKKPAQAYNPLFLYGNTGLGKTHLLKAIRNEINKNFPQMKTIYIKGEEFMNEMIENLANKTMPEFKNKYRNIDVLLIDDIQFIAGKDSTQEEFFHTFNALYEANKQIIIASDRPPKEIQLLESRLRSRFESGIITDIYMPEYELKVAIIKTKAKAYGIDLPDDVVEFVAMKIKNNIRQLEGVIKKIMAFQLISDTPPSITVASSAVKDITNENEPTPVLVDKIINEVCREFDVTEDEIKSKKRVESISFARQVAMYIMRELTDLSLPDIGRYFGGKDHSTVHHSIKKVETKMEMSTSFRDRMNGIIKNVKEK